MPVLTERSVEVPWAIANAQPPTLDVGCAESDYLADLAGPVDGIDVRPADMPLDVFFEGDIRTIELPTRYRTVLAISTIEHIGLAHGPYGTTADDPEHGDRRAVEGCMRHVADSGQLLMSVPYNYGAGENRGWYRVYSHDSLCRLLDGFDWDLEVHMNDQWTVGGVALVTVTA